MSFPFLSNADLLDGCQIIPGDDGIDTVIFPPCTVTPERLAQQHLIMTSANVPLAWTYMNLMHPAGSAFHAGITGRGTRPNFQVERPDGSVWTYFGHVQPDGSFRLRGDLQYKRENLVLLGFTSGVPALAA